LIRTAAERIVTWLALKFHYRHYTVMTVKNSAEYVEMWSWLDRNQIDWYIKWDNTDSKTMTFYFTSSRDKVMFLLRWA